MLIILLAYLGGILTILSPCILPVLPFVFARADRSFVRSTLPLLAGMAATFAIVATLAAVGGGWAVRANAIGRWAALILLALFGIALVFPSHLRPDDAAAGRARLAPVRAPAGREGKRLVVGRARRRDRPAVGAVRGADPRHHLHRRRAPGRERQHDAAAARLRARRRDLARARLAGRRQAVRADEEVAGRQRAHPPGPRRAGARRRRRDRARPRHARAFETVERADREPRIRPRPQARREPGDGRNQRRAPARWASSSCPSKARCRRSTGSARGSTRRRSPASNCRARSW